MNVKLTYFKSTGKYYSEGEFSTDDILPMYQIFQQARRLLERGELPGLAYHHGPYFVLVDAVNHPDNYPHILVPDIWKDKIS